MTTPESQNEADAGQSALNVGLERRMVDARNAYFDGISWRYAFDGEASVEEYDFYGNKFGVYYAGWGKAGELAVFTLASNAELTGA